MSGMRDHEGDRLAVYFGDPDQVLEDDRLQLLAGIGDLGLGQRHEAPIVRPGVVEEVEDDRALPRRTCDLSTLRMRMRGLLSPAAISRSITGIMSSCGCRARR